jgi:phosphohistidine phosphatase
MAGGRERKLVLFRHAKSAWPDVADHERPLAKRGRRDAPVMGRWLRDAGCVPDQVLCSTARRARQTWKLAAAGLAAAPPVTFERGVYQASAGELLDLIRQVPPTVQALLVVGHDPAIHETALMLAATAPDAGAAPDAAAALEPGTARPGALERMGAKFPTAAIAVLQFTGAWPGLGPGGARLVTFITPRDLADGRAVSRLR